ncbi:MAG TPA: hypothetical protein VFT84_04715 [Gemmatimonadales bacterium]|nr:hypothetical protein [Gemmatimonadales bacterium]
MGAAMLRRALPWAILAACRSAPADEARFAGVQDRGGVAMGVDQYTSSHVFEPLPDGGRIVLQRGSVDPAGTQVIREHMRRIAAAFAAGDFGLPGFVHAQKVPGTAIMAARREAISYTADTLPRGGEVRIRTTDSAAVRAVHEFLAFQRSDHHAGAHLHSDTTAP